MSKLAQYFYEGEYEDLLDWIIDAYPPKMYKKFNEWLTDVKEKFFSDNKHFSNDIGEEMKQFWIDNNFGKLDIPPEDTRPTKRAKSFNTIRELGIFKNRDVYDANPNRKQYVIRRELQELVKEGKLERVKSGVYRVK